MSPFTRHHHSYATFQKTQSTFARSTFLRGSSFCDIAKVLKRCLNHTKIPFGMDRASCERYLRMLSQLELVYPRVSRNVRIAQRLFLEIPTREVMKKAQGIWQFANRHPVITAMVLLLLFTIFLPLVLFSAFVLTCLLIGLGTALVILTSFLILAGILSLPFILPALTLTVIATTSMYFGIRFTMTTVRWARGQIGCAFLKPSGVYRELHHRFSELFLSCTGDMFISHFQKSDKPAQGEDDSASEEREAEDEDGDGRRLTDVRENDATTDTVEKDKTAPKAARPKDRDTRKRRKKPDTDAQKGASGATYTGRGKCGHNDVHQGDAAVQSACPADGGESDDDFTEASEWLTEDEFGNIIPDYRDKDMKLYDAMARKGFKEYEPWPY